MKLAPMRVQFSEADAREFERHVIGLLYLGIVDDQDRPVLRKAYERIVVHEEPQTIEQLDECAAALAASRAEIADRTTPVTWQGWGADERAAGHLAETFSQNYARLGEALAIVDRARDMIRPVAGSKRVELLAALQALEDRADEDDYRRRTERMAVDS